MLFGSFSLTMLSALVGTKANIGKWFDVDTFITPDEQFFPI